MPRVDRAQRFLLNPHAFMDDPAVQRMSLGARGAYAMLWLAGWDQKVPGVYINDDRVLAQLARCTPQEWSEVRAEVLSAFSVTSSVTERDTLTLPAFSVTLASQSQKRDMDRERQRRKRLRERDSHAVSQRDSLDGSGSGSKRSDSERLLTLNPILPARPATPPARKPESTPVAQRPVNRTDTKPNPDALERATCHRCRNKFARPVGSQRTLCPPCHDSG